MALIELLILSVGWVITHRHTGESYSCTWIDLQTKLEAERAAIFHLEIGAMQKEVIQVEQIIVKRRSAKHVVCQVNREKMPNTKIVVEMIEVGDDIILGHRAGIFPIAQRVNL